MIYGYYHPLYSTDTVTLNIKFERYPRPNDTKGICVKVRLVVEDVDGPNGNALALRKTNRQIMKEMQELQPSKPTYHLKLADLLRYSDRRNYFRLDIRQLIDLPSAACIRTDFMRKIHASAQYDELDEPTDLFSAGPLTTGAFHDNKTWLLGPTLYDDWHDPDDTDDIIIGYEDIDKKEVYQGDFDSRIVRRFLVSLDLNLPLLKWQPAERLEVVTSVRSRARISKMLKDWRFIMFPVRETVSVAI